jgi:hypothetical protein
MPLAFLLLTGAAARAANLCSDFGTSCNVCYYDMDLGAGNPNQLAPITAAGQIAIDVTVPDAGTLAGCDVFFVLSEFSSPSAEWTANQAAIEAAIRAGMVMVFHDRGVSSAPTYVPGLGSATCTLSYGYDIDVAHKGTSITHGPGGFVDDVALDGGTSSDHGYCDPATLPARSDVVLTRTNPDEPVTFSYRLDSGAVVYSTIPLGYYLVGASPFAFRDVYAPNVVQYGVDLIPADVCYYDLGPGMGTAAQAATIVAAGHRPVNIAVPDAATLAGCQVLYAHNSDNLSYAAEWTTNLAAIDAAVQAGMVLVFHDRYVTDAAIGIPGLGSALCYRDTLAEDDVIDIETVGTSVTKGPGGFLTNASLDGGSSSSHGYCEAPTLPGGAVVVLSRSSATHGVTQSYRLGTGAVVYSTIPLDYYESSPGSLPAAFREIYAPNVVQYGVDLLPAPVCYHRLGLGAGDADQAASIAAAGHNAVNLATLDGPATAGCDVLYVHNPDNATYDTEWTSNLTDIDLAVRDGLVLAFHDRYVTGAASNMPGLGAATCTRDPSADIDIEDSTTVVTDGPGGVLTDTSLDGFTSSTHGYCDASTLPGGSHVVLRRPSPGEAVTFSYLLEEGGVIYSPIPLDAWDSGTNAFADTYAPNVVEYAVRLPEPRLLHQQLAGAAALLLLAAHRARRSTRRPHCSRTSP